MNIQVTSDSAFARTLSITVPASKVSAELDRAFKTLQARARLPGFRKGKAPLSVLEANFGPRVKSDVAEALINEAYRSALDAHKLEPVSRPRLVDTGDIRGGADFTFVIGVDVRPTIEVANYEGLEVTKPLFTVSDAEVEANLAARAKAAARFVEASRPAALGDLVQVELKGTVDGETVLDEPGTLLRTGGDLWLKGAESFVVGLGVGEDKSGEVTFADDARNTAVAGRTVALTAKVLAVQSLEAPELSDALAEELGFEGGLEGMRARVREELGKGREELALNQARANLLQALIDANTVEVPPAMVEQNLQLLQEELKLQRAYQGEDPRNIRFSQAQIADLRNRAAFAAKGALLLEGVWTAQAITVEEADVEAKYAQLAAERGQTVEAVRGWFVKDDAVEDLRQRILEEKTLDWLLARAKVTEAAPEAASASGEAAEAEAPGPEAAAPAKKASGGKYKTIGGVKYAKDLLDQAEEAAAAGGPLDLAAVQALATSARDGKGATSTEKRTLAYIREQHGLSDEAAAWLAEQADLQE